MANEDNKPTLEKPNLGEMLTQVASDITNPDRHNVVLDLFRAAQSKPGVQTSEFYLSFLLTLVGTLMQFWPGHETIGGGIMVAAGVSYTLSRGIVKAATVKRVGMILLAAGLFFASGCGTKGYVRADATHDTVIGVCDRHDSYVQKDASLSDAEKQSDLRDTALLRQLWQEALNPTPSPSPSPAPAAK